ncbi:MAG: glycosyltransferase [Vampirovibrio sp.]|nr:glycosyltransferase [Vampirovibrio sp.]
MFSTSSSSTSTPLDPTWQPLISIILPVYNGEDSILAAVRSVLAQTYQNFQLIAVNDGSSDGTKALLDTITDPRVKVVHQENQGVLVTRDNAFRHAEGEYIGFIDADDIWLPTKLEAELAVIQRHGQPACLVYSWYYAVDEANRLFNLSPKFTDAGNVFETILNNESVMLPSTTLMHRQVYEHIGGFEKIDANCEVEDRPFFILACKDFPAFPTEQRLVVYRQSMDGRCRSLLKHFDRATRSEELLVASVRHVLTDAQADKLGKMQTKFLFYRFLMYNFVKEARILYEKVDPQLLTDKKGLLAKLSMQTGINVLYVARRVVQTCFRYALSGWWTQKSSFLQDYYQPLSPQNTMKDPSHAGV